MICKEKVKTANSLINRQVTDFRKEIIGKAVTADFAMCCKKRFDMTPTLNFHKGHHRPKRLRSLLEIKELKWLQSESM